MRRMPLAMALVMLLPALSGCIDVAELLFPGTPADPEPGPTHVWAPLLAMPGATRADVLSFHVTPDVAKIRIIDPGLAVAPRTDDPTSQPSDPRTASSTDIRTDGVALIPLLEHRTVRPNHLHGTWHGPHETAYWLITPDGTAVDLSTGRARLPTEGTDGGSHGGTDGAAGPSEDDQAGSNQTAPTSNATGPSDADRTRSRTTETPPTPAHPPGIFLTADRPTPGEYRLVTYGDTIHPFVDLALDAHDSVALDRLVRTDHPDTDHVWPHTIQALDTFVERQHVDATPGPLTSRALLTTDHDGRTEALAVDGAGSIDLPDHTLWAWLDLMGIGANVETVLTTPDGHDVHHQHRWTVTTPQGSLYDGNDWQFGNTAAHRDQHRLPEVTSLEWLIEGTGDIDGYVHSVLAPEAAPATLSAIPLLGAATDVTARLAKLIPLDGTVRASEPRLAPVSAGSTLFVSLDTNDDDRTSRFRLVDPTTGQTLLHAKTRGGNHAVTIPDVPGPLLLVNDGSSPLSVLTDQRPHDAVLHRIDTTYQHGTIEMGARDDGGRTARSIELPAAATHFEVHQPGTGSTTDTLVHLTNRDGKPHAQWPPLEWIRPDMRGYSGPWNFQGYFPLDAHRIDAGIQMLRIDTTSGSGTMEWSANVIDLDDAQRVLDDIDTGH